MAHVLTVLADGFEETEAITFIDLLRRAEIKVTILGLSSLDVTGSHGITLKADALLESFSGSFDGIILPGGQPGTTNLAQSGTVLRMVRDAHANGLLCAAICAAPGVLGKSGILRDRLATCYPGSEKNLEGAVLSTQNVVEDGNIITSRGVGTAIEFSLRLISYLSGSEISEKVKKAILFQ